MVALPMRSSLLVAVGLASVMAIILCRQRNHDASFVRRHGQSLTMPATALYSSLIAEPAAAQQHQRHLGVSGSDEPYHVVTARDLGPPNPDAAIGNPLKGLVPCPQYNRPPYLTNVPHALEFYYIGTELSR
jgi:hypothetical protein